MHQNQPHTKIQQARVLRKNMTEAEWKLWDILRGPQCDYKFRRQHAIDPYIIDFYCPRLRLIIEADGGQHNPQVDGRRDAFLRAHGYHILRFWNNDILENSFGVWEKIRQEIDLIISGASPPP